MEPRRPQSGWVNVSARLPAGVSLGKAHGGTAAIPSRDFF
jgi:hypothetical protein